MGAVEQAGIYTEAQVKNKENELNQLKVEIDNFHRKLEVVKVSFEKQNKTLIDELNSRHENIKHREAKLNDLEIESRRRENFARESEGKVISKMKELDSLKQEYVLKLEKIKSLIAELSK